MLYNMLHIYKPSGLGLGGGGGRVNSGHDTSDLN